MRTSRETDAKIVAGFGRLGEGFARLGGGLGILFLAGAAYFMLKKHARYGGSFDSSDTVYACVCAALWVYTTYYLRSRER